MLARESHGGRSRDWEAASRSRSLLLTDLVLLSNARRPGDVQAGTPLHRVYNLRFFVATGVNMVVGMHPI